jgi:hypothetical protein
MEDEPQSCVWTFTGLYNVDMGGHDEVDLGGGFFLSKPTPSLLSVRSRVDLSGRQFDEMEAVHCFLIHRESLPLLRGPERIKKIDHFQNGLMALQVLKPLKTFGIIFQASEVGNDRLNLERGCARPPIDPGEWAGIRSFDTEFISQVPAIIESITRVMSGRPAEPKNAINLLQLALEHFHPLVTGLLCVMGLEAALDGKGRNDFRKRLCECLGESTRVFPDWNSPSYQPPAYTVGGIAVDLYMLRNKIAHGINLREAAQDKKTPVDLLEKVQVVQDSPSRAYCLLLSEAAIYLLCAVIRKTVLA